MRLTYKTTLKLHPIHIREDKKNYIVEDKITGEFFEMPSVCIHAIKMLENETSLLEIENELKAVYPQEEVNMIDFAKQLVEMELIQEVDGQPIEIKESIPEKLGYMWIPEKFAKFFFNRFAISVYALLFLVNIGILFAKPEFVPHYKDLFAFDMMMLNMLVYMIISFSLVFIHEMGHVLALRAVGMPAKIEISHRLVLVVLQTDMSKVWGLEPQKRNVLYLAGLCFDNIILFLALTLLMLFPNQTGFGLGILGIIVFDVIIRIIYQCCIYMKTDLYYVFENITGCYNLIENAQNYFKEKFSFNKGKFTNEIFVGEKPVVISYGIFYLLGMVLTLSLFIVFFIPQIFYAMKVSIPALLLPFSTIYFWDAVFVLLQLFIGGGLLLYSWRKSYKMKYK